MTKKSRYFLIGGGDDKEIEQEGLLPKIDDNGIEKLYAEMASIDPNQSKFSGTKREYVLRMYMQMETFVTYQRAFVPDKMVGGVEPDDPVKLANDLFELVKKLQVNSREQKEKIEDMLSDFFDKEIIYKYVNKIINKEVITSSDILKDILKSREISKEDTKKIMDTNIEFIENKITALPFEKVKEEEEFKGDEALSAKKQYENKITEVNETVTTYVNSQVEDMTEDRIRQLVTAFGKMAENLKNAINTNAQYLTDQAKEVSLKVMTLTMYPYVGDFENFNGIGTQERRLFYRFSRGQTYMTLEQGKVGEWMIRTNKKLLEDCNLLEEQFSLGTFLFDMSLLDQDIMDLQVIINNMIRFAETKTKKEKLAKPTFQQTKSILFANALISGRKIDGVGFDKDWFDKNGSPLFVNVFNQEALKYTVKSREAVPLTIQYDGLILIKQLENVPYKLGMNMLQALQQEFMLDNFKFENNRIVSKKSFKPEYEVFIVHTLIKAKLKEYASKNNILITCDGIVAAEEESDESDEEESDEEEVGNGMFVGGVKKGDKLKKIKEYAEQIYKDIKSFLDRSTDIVKKEYIKKYICNAGSMGISIKDTSEISWTRTGKGAIAAYKKHYVNSKDGNVTGDVTTGRFEIGNKFTYKEVVPMTGSYPEKFYTTDFKIPLATKLKIPSGINTGIIGRPITQISELIRGLDDTDKNFYDRWSTAERMNEKKTPNLTISPTADYLIKNVHKDFQLKKTGNERTNEIGYIYKLVYNKPSDKPSAEKAKEAFGGWAKYAIDTYNKKNTVEKSFKDYLTDKKLIDTKPRT